MMQSHSFQIAPDSQEFVILLSLDSLQEVWKHMHVDVADPDGMMRAARQVIIRMKPERQTPRAEVSEAFLQTLDEFCGPAAAQTMRHWFATIDGRPHDQSLRLWMMWLSANQHKLSIPGLDPLLIVQLLGAYRKDVVQATKTLETLLIEKVSFIRLSDWDLSIHAAHRICYFAQGRFDNSLTFLALLSEKRSRAGTRFLQDWAAVLPAPFQSDLRNIIVQGLQEATRPPAPGDPASHDGRIDAGPVLAMGVH